MVHTLSYTYTPYMLIHVLYKIYFSYGRWIYVINVLDIKGWCQVYWTEIFNLISLTKANFPIFLWVEGCNLSILWGNVLHQSLHPVVSHPSEATGYPLCRQSRGGWSNVCMAGLQSGVFTNQVCFSLRVTVYRIKIVKANVLFFINLLCWFQII